MYLQCLIFCFHKELFNYWMSDSQEIVYCWIKLIFLFYVFTSWKPCKGKLRYIRKNILKSSFLKKILPVRTGNDGWQIKIFNQISIIHKSFLSFWDLAATKFEKNLVMFESILFLAYIALQKWHSVIVSKSLTVSENSVKTYV